MRHTATHLQLTWQRLRRGAQELLECSPLDVSELLDLSHEAASRVLKCVSRDSFMAVALTMRGLRHALRR